MIYDAYIGPNVSWSFFILLSNLIFLVGGSGLTSSKLNLWEPSEAILCLYLRTYYFSFTAKNNNSFFKGF